MVPLSLIRRNSTNNIFQVYIVIISLPKLHVLIGQVFFDRKGLSVISKVRRFFNPKLYSMCTRSSRPQKRMSALVTARQIVKRVDFRLDLLD